MSINGGLIMEDEGMKNELIPVTLENNQKIYIEATQLGGEELVAFEEFGFEEIGLQVESISNSLKNVFERVRPEKASIEFGVNIGVEAGKLTALLVKGTGSASIKINLEWSRNTGK